MKDKRNNTIVITGASSGIGLASALALDKASYNVFAGVRNQKDANRLLKYSNSITPLMIDVKNIDSIEKAFNFVNEKSGGQIYGLLNNAGIAPVGILEFMSEEDIRNIIEVNLTGLLMVTKAFIPLLRKGKGRIVNMGSSAGILAAPAWSVYSATKFGVEAITDSLRLELHSSNIKVSVIEPGIIKTPLWQKGHSIDFENIRNNNPDEYSLYEKQLKSLENLFQNPKAIPVEKVSKAVEHAFSAKRPKYRYTVGTLMDVKGMKFLSKLPTFFRDLILKKTIEMSR